MAIVDLKTKPNSASVEGFIDSVAEEERRVDAKVADKYFREIAKEEPVMWGSSIIGYGNEHLKYESGREMDWMRIGFSPRKANLTFYVIRGGVDRYQDLLNKLGKHSLGKGCLYIKRLSDVDASVLKQIIKRAWDS